MPRSPNLAQALTILASAEMAEHAAHADVSAFGAPSECHALVSRGETARKRQARKHAESVARRPYRVIKREALSLGIELYSPYCRTGASFVIAFIARWPRLIVDPLTVLYCSPLTPTRFHLES